MISRESGASGGGVLGWRGDRVVVGEKYDHAEHGDHDGEESGEKMEEGFVEHG